MKTIDYLAELLPQVIYNNCVLFEDINMKEGVKNLTIELTVNGSGYNPSVYTDRIFVSFYDLMYTKQIAHIINNCYQNEERFEIPNSIQNETFDVSVQPISMDEEKFNDILPLSDSANLDLEDSLFIYAFLFITFHELGHFINDSKTDINGEYIEKSKYDKEVNADDVAFDAIKEEINNSNNEQKKELITIGIIIGIGFILFANKTIDTDTDHPHPVERMKTFFDKVESVSNESYKIACEIIQTWDKTSKNSMSDMETCSDNYKMRFEQYVELLTVQQSNT